MTQIDLDALRDALEAHQYAFLMNREGVPYSKPNHYETIKQAARAYLASQSTPTDDIDNDHGVIFESGKQEADKEWRQKLYKDGGRELIAMLTGHYNKEHLISVISAAKVEVQASEAQTADTREALDAEKYVTGLEQCVAFLYKAYEKLHEAILKYGAGDVVLNAPTIQGTRNIIAFSQASKAVSGMDLAAFALEKMKSELERKSIRAALVQRPSVNDDTLLNDALKALNDLTTNRFIDLGDLVYKVRETEGMGWEGAGVKEWSAAVQHANITLEKLKERLDK